MKAIDFKQKNRTYTAPGCFDMPAYNDGTQTIMIWQFTPAELEELQRNGGKFHISLMAGKTIPPIACFLQDPFFEPEHAEAFSEIVYCAVIAAGNKDDLRVVYNSIDRPAPKFLRMGGRQYTKDPRHKPRRTMTPIVPPGQHYIRFTTEEERKHFDADVALVLIELGGAMEGLIPIPKQS